MKWKNLAKPLLITGLVAGTLDGLAAVLVYYVQTEKNPFNVFRFIASGVFGMDAFTGGLPMALWGIVFHYLIAFCWTILFFWLCDRFSTLIHNWIMSGILYGIFIWLTMNLLVVPLSLVPMKAGPKEWSGILKGVLILVACVGMPISYSARMHLKGNS